MDEKRIQSLLDLIGVIVNASGKTWNEKRDAVLAVASDDEKTNLEEFAGWFAFSRE
jgi:hypothetical protein